MVGTNGRLTSNYRSEFSAADIDRDIEYQRTGGCFVTTKKAVVLAIFAVVVSAVVITLLYLYGPHVNLGELKTDETDIEQLLNETVRNASRDEVHLPENVYPMAYQLQLQPVFNENSPDNIVFTGKVKIRIACTSITKTITLNSENLKINPSEVRVTAESNLRLKSMSQLMKNAASVENLTSNAIQEKGLPPENVSHVIAITPNTEALFSTSTPNPLLLKGLSQPAKSKVDIKLLTENISSGNSSQVERANTSNDLSPAKLSIDNSSHFEEINASGATSSPLPTIIPVTTAPPSNSTKTNDNSKSPSLYFDDSTIKNSIDVMIKEQEEDRNKSLYIIHLLTPMHPGENYTLEITFSGMILNNLVGLYKTSYADSSGQQRWFITTNMYPAYTRRVFPCFDDSTYTTPFEVVIARNSTMTALSHMPLKESKPIPTQPGWIWDSFEQTLPMPTYLLAFTIFDFSNLTASQISPVFNVWTPQIMINETSYATNVGPKILSFLEMYLDIKYPLPKIDLLALPELPEVLASSPGLISFEYTELLTNSIPAKWIELNDILKSASYKLANEFLGIFVTPKRLSDIWINEGFAHFMESLIRDFVQPDAKYSEDFPLHMQKVLDSDTLKTAHSLHGALNIIGQFEDELDVTYNKGSCLFRMLNYTLTSTVFQIGMRNYIKKWSYKSTTQENLWECFTEAANTTNVLPSDVSLTDIMNSWTNQEGYPVITVTLDYETGSAVVEQSRFVEENSTASDNLWYVPLSYTTKQIFPLVEKLWLKKEKYITIQNLTTGRNSSWILFNIEQSGFYRVNYDNANWKLLQFQLETDPEMISISNRAQLLNDAFELAKVGELDYSVPFDLTKYLAANENSYIPWYSALHSLKSLQDMIGSTHVNDLYIFHQDYVINITKTVYNTLGLREQPDESQNNKLLRNIVVQTTCDLSYQTCTDWAKESFQRWMSATNPLASGNSILGEFGQVIQCTAINLGGEKEWRFLWKMTLSPFVSEENLQMSYLSLGCTREPWLIDSYLEKSINGSIKLAHIPYVWESLGSNPVGLSVGFRFLRQNWKRICNSNCNLFLDEIVDNFLSKLSTETDLKDLTSFYKEHITDFTSVSSSLLSVVDRIKSRIFWKQTRLEEVATWLNEYKQNLNTT